MSYANVVAVRKHHLADRESRIVGLDDFPRQVDPRDHRVDAGDAPCRRRGKTVFVVDPRTMDLDENITLVGAVDFSGFESTKPARIV